jgi:glycosyltransferase involved in cell wall biosynthesis
MTSPVDTFVSVVIPVYDGEAYLEEAVQSVLAQTHCQMEVVVVDDGSADRTPEVAARLRDAIRYVRQTNGGPAAAMNRGVALARGEFISFLSADDVWMPQKLEWQLAVAFDRSKAELVFGHVQHFISPELDADQARSLRCPPEPMPAYSAGTLLCRLETFRRVGPFDERWRVGEFFDWYERAKDLDMPMSVVPQVVSRRRVHCANHSLRARAPSAGYAQVLKGILDRRRQRSVDGSPPCD